MIYNEFQGKRLSALGLGCMRLPGGGYGNAHIEMTETEKMFDYAMQKGINYFDTAYGYHAGQSEIVVGQMLKKYPRESFYLADKFPGYDLSTFAKKEQVFEEQLQKTGLGYFDFYLFHNVCELNIEQYLDESYGLFEYLLKQKEKGLIRHLGFSTHGSLETITRFLEKYGHAMEFCQLQVNWLDWTFLKGKEQMELLEQYGIPVWIMEPLRGGKLAKLSPSQEERLKALRPDEGIPAWSFRFLQGLPQVKVTLSGMSDFAQLQENIQTYESAKPLNEKELQTLSDISEEILQTLMPCTACRYCTNYCPMQLDIPQLLELYNDHLMSSNGVIPAIKISALPNEKRPSACIGCRACEQVCPQNIKISKALAHFTERLTK